MTPAEFQARVVEQLEQQGDLLLTLLKAQRTTTRLVDLVLERLDQHTIKGAQLMATMQQVQDQVTKTDNVMDGAVVLLSNLSQMLKDAQAHAQNGDTEATKDALNKVIADLDQRTEALASAIVKNTPVDPNPQPPAPQQPGDNSGAAAPGGNEPAPADTSASDKDTNGGTPESPFAS